MSGVDRASTGSNEATGKPAAGASPDGLPGAWMGKEVIGSDRRATARMAGKENVSMAVAKKEGAIKREAEAIITVRIVGDSPMMQHHGRLSDPTDPYSVKLKKITAKKNKTESDYEEMAKIEVEASLYWDEKGDVCVPDSWIEGMLTAAAKKRKQGKSFTAAVLCEEPTFKLEYAGKTKGLTKEQIALDPQFRDRRRCVVSQRAVWRCRPIFKEWALTFSLRILPGAGVTVDDVREALDIGGSVIGLSEYRPKFGRFHVESFKVE